jgi:hypothetical protein
MKGRGRGVLEEQLRQAWQTRARNVPIQSVLHFTSEGLVFGAGTVLVAADANRRFRKAKGQEARILALLSAAYGKAVPPRVLGNINRATTSWWEGDDCLAYIHLAHAGLHEPQDPYEAARCLFMADALLKTGTSPAAILKALKFEAAYIDAVEKLYNPLEPRVPKGSGRISGQWRRLLSVLAELTGPQAESLGALGARLLLRAGGVATTVFGILFIPSSNKISIGGEVSGAPGLRYSWNRDETQLLLTYTRPDGTETTLTAELEEDVFRNQRGQIVGRVLPDDSVAVDTAAISPDLGDKDEPRLCPMPGADKKSGERGWDYEDVVKAVVNPYPLTTPRGIGFQLPSSDNSGELVYFDDCQHATGMMVEAKGPEYAWLLTIPKARKNITDNWLNQSAAQIAAAGTRRIRWYFAEPEAAEYARELFRYSGQGRERIEIEVLPWSKKKQ